MGGVAPRLEPLSGKCLRAREITSEVHAAMTAPIESQFLVSRWDAGHAATLSEPEVLLYRSNILGADQRITNYGGGNTSAKLDGTDRLTGDKAEILWVKGSGG